MGLGSNPEIGLAEARELCANAFLALRVGRDPIDDRDPKRHRAPQAVCGRD